MEEYILWSHQKKKKPVDRLTYSSIVEGLTQIRLSTDLALIENDINSRCSDGTGVGDY